MKKKLILGLLVGAICLLGAAALAYQEAPVLRVKVAAGEIPRLEQRLPDEPAVLEPLAVSEPEIGQYGGTAYVFTTGIWPWGDMLEQPERGSYLLRMNMDGKIVPDMAKGYEISDDAKAFTLYLRKGMKWSDGSPFTADDFVFKMEDMAWNDKVTTWWDSDEPVREIKKIDDYTVRWEFTEPYPRFPLTLIDWRGSEWMRFAPKQYLKKWHIKYNPEADELAKQEGYENWWEAFNYHQEVAPSNDINKPTLEPWMFEEFTSSLKVFERNPYYHAVDQAGNQLPYIDRIVSTVVDGEVYQMKIMTGEADVAYSGTLLENYPLYKENEEKGGYRVVLLPGILGSEIGYPINQNVSDPVTREIYQDIRFRQALSLAINREEINDSLYFGLATPRQATVLPSCRYYKEEWGKAYAQYDPDEANRLLDEMGLTERDKNGFRKGPDGQTFLIVINIGEKTSANLELVKEYWEDVGLKVVPKMGPRDQTDPDHPIFELAISGAQEFYNYISGGFAKFGPGDGSVGWAYAWGEWLDAKQQIKMGFRTLEYFGGELPGEEPPEEIKEHWDNVIKRYNSEYGSEEYMELSEKIYDFMAEKLYVIGTVGMVPSPFIVKKNMGNVPAEYFPTAEERGSLNYFTKFLFFKQ